MVVATKTQMFKSGYGQIHRYSETSGADTELAMSTPAATADTVRRLRRVSVVYSASPTQAGVTTVFDSGVGSGHDVTLDTGSADVQENSYIPTVEVDLMDDDVITVTAPAGGGVITAAITIVVEELPALAT